MHKAMLLVFREKDLVSLTSEQPLGVYSCWVCQWLGEELLNVQQVTLHQNTDLIHRSGGPDTPVTLCCVQLHWPTGLEQEMLHLGMFQVPSPAGESAADCSLSVTYHPCLLHMTQNGSYGRSGEGKSKRVLTNWSSLQNAFVSRKQAPGLIT